MQKSIRELLLKKLYTEGKIKVSDIVLETGFSRAYLNRFIQELRNDGKIVLIGKANRAHYVNADKQSVLDARKKILSVHKTLKNENLSDDSILQQIQQETGIFEGLKSNLSEILRYALTEILNNAIEHSESQSVEVLMRRTQDTVHFEIMDRGIGIFNNIRQKKGLQSNLEAIQDLLKGKQTTMPHAHSGEGIFFTSKMADTFVISSYEKKLVFNNLLEDIFIQDIRKFKGTKVIFTIALHSHKRSRDIFNEYAGDSYEFNKTSVAVRLYKMGNIYISRSQARRVLTGLDQFKYVTLDFNHITAIGQAFADEVFRVWKYRNPDIEIIPKNANENVEFMIRHSGATGSDVQQLPLK